MKTMIDKKYTDAGMLETVRASLKEFRARYTEGDLLRAFAEACGDHSFEADEIIKCTVTGFSTCDQPWYSVEIITDGLINLHRVRFYTDIELNVDKNPLMISCERYA